MHSKGSFRFLVSCGVIILGLFLSGPLAAKGKKKGKGRGKNNPQCVQLGGSLGGPFLCGPADVAARVSRSDVAVNGCQKGEGNKQEFAFDKEWIKVSSQNRCVSDCDCPQRCCTSRFSVLDERTGVRHGACLDLEAMDVTAAAFSVCMNDFED